MVCVLRIYKKACSFLKIFCKSCCLQHFNQLIQIIIIISQGTLECIRKIKIVVIGEIKQKESELTKNDGWKNKITDTFLGAFADYDSLNV